MKQQLMTTGNKHVRMDSNGREYYKLENGTWAPGHYNGKAFVWDSTTKYAARSRTFEMPDGTEKSVRLTKYTYERFYKPAYAPVGKNGKQYKRAYKECYRALYWDGTDFWQAVNLQRADGTWYNSIRIFERWDLIWDRYPEIERDITALEPVAA